MKIPNSRIKLLLDEGVFIDTESPQINERVKKGLTSRFSFSAIDTTKFIDDIKLINSLNQRGKRVIIYLPPLSYESFSLFANTEMQSEFYDFTINFMPRILDQYNLDYISTEHSKNYNLDDTYFIDGIHPSEVFVAIQIKNHINLFEDYVDEIILDSIIETRFCNLLFDRSEYFN